MLAFRPNPIIIKELRSRMRGPRAFAILTGFLLLLGAFTYGLYRIVTYNSGIYGGGAPMGAVVGRAVFIGLAFFELGLVCLITPALTAGAISGEEERRTLDMLLATPLRVASVLWGKLISALTYIFLLILAGIPMASIVFILGGVTPADMAQALAILVLCAVTFGVLGLFCSAVLRRTGRAMVASYVIMLLLMFGSYFLYILLAVLRRGEPSRAFLVANPIAAMAAAVAGDLRPDVFGSVLGPFTSVLWALSGTTMTAGKTAPAGATTVTLRSLWHYTGGIYGLATVLLYLASIQSLKPIRRWRPGRAGVVGLAVFLLLAAAGGYLFYGPPSYARLGYPSLPPNTQTGIDVRMLSSVQPAMAVAVPAPPLPAVTEAPAPTPTPPGATAPVAAPAASAGPRPTTTPPVAVLPETTGAVYAAAVARAIADAPCPAKEALILDSTGAGLLADPKVDGAAPQPLDKSVMGAMLSITTERAGVSASALQLPKDGAFPGSLSGQVVIGLGQLTWTDGSHVRVPLSRYCGPDQYDARIYTVVPIKEGWEVSEDSGPLVKG